MASTEKGETGGKESPPLQIDPKCFQDALRTFFQPIKTNDPRLDFYTIYKREATEYDLDYVKKYDEDLNTTLIFAGLFSAVCSAFVIDIYSKLQPDPNDQSAALFRAILLTLNHSAIPNESPTASPTQQNPPSEIVTVTGLLYASLLTSLLAAFVAMLGKQWLNRYLRHAGGSMIERCGDRQRKCDGLEKWPFHLFVESLPLMLQISLLLLACGLCRYMITVNTSVAYILTTLTSLGVLFYIGIVIASTHSYDCPFQTPGSARLRNLWTRVGPHIIPILLPTINVLHTLAGAIWRQIILFRLFLTNTYHHLRTLLKRTPHRTPPISTFLQQMELNFHPNPLSLPLPTTQQGPNSTSQEIIPWFATGELAMLQNKNSSDVCCVAWVLNKITDPDALDTALQLAGTIWWFDAGLDVEAIYNQVVIIFHTCFGSNGELYPELRNKAYYSGRAILWIYVLAVCKKFKEFHLPTRQYTVAASDHDLSHILGAFSGTNDTILFKYLVHEYHAHTPPHSQWTSGVLLHLSWAIPHWKLPTDVTLLSDYHGIPLDVTLNRLLMYCNFLGSPIEEDVLKIADKSDRLVQILSFVSGAIVMRLGDTINNHAVVYSMLLLLAELKNHPLHLAEMSYRWCTTIWENCHDESLQSILFCLSLEVGFHHVNSYNSPLPLLPHPEHVQGFFEIVLQRGDNERMGDLLCASLMLDPSGQLAFDVYAKYIVDHGARGPFSPRLQKMFISCAERIDFGTPEEVKKEKFVELLNHLGIGVKDVENREKWITMLLKIIKSPNGVHKLAISPWELLAELKTGDTWPYTGTYSPDVTASLLVAEEWDKLKCWMGVAWVIQANDPDNITEDLKHATATLFHHQPGAVQKFMQWMEQWSKRWSGREIPESLYQIYQQACEEVPDIGLLKLITQ